MGVFGNGYIYKQPIRTLEESFNLFESEGNNYNKLFESINILAEANIKTAFQTIIQKIKDFFIWLGNKIKEIWNKIFHRHKATEQKAEEVIKQNEEIEKEIEHLDEKKQDLEDTKSRVISNIQARHNAAAEEIKKSIENIKNNKEELNKQREENRKILDKMNSDLDDMISGKKSSESKANKKPKLKVESKQEAKEKKFEYKVYDGYLANYAVLLSSNFEITNRFISFIDRDLVKKIQNSNFELDELAKDVYDDYTSKVIENSSYVLKTYDTEKLKELESKEGNFETASRDIMDAISRIDASLENCSKMKEKFEKDAKEYEHYEPKVSKEFAENITCQKYLTKAIAEDADRIKKYLAALMNYTNAVESLKAKMVSQLDSINKQMANV